MRLASVAVMMPILYCFSRIVRQLVSVNTSEIAAKVVGVPLQPTNLLVHTSRNISKKGITIIAVLNLQYIMCKYCLCSFRQDRHHNCPFAAWEAIVRCPTWIFQVGAHHHPCGLVEFFMRAGSMYISKCTQFLWLTTAISLTSPYCWLRSKKKLALLQHRIHFSDTLGHLKQVMLCAEQCSVQTCSYTMCLFFLLG